MPVWRLSPIVQLRFTMFCIKCIWMPEMCPGPRWIDYPAPRSPADCFVMAGPIRHGLLRACSVVQRRPLKRFPLTVPSSSSVVSFTQFFLPHTGTRLCPLCDGDEVFGGGGGDCLRGRRAHRVAGSIVGEPLLQLTDCVLSM